MKITYFNCWVWFFCLLFFCHYLYTNVVTQCHDSVVVVCVFHQLSSLWYRFLWCVRIIYSDSVVNYYWFVDFIVRPKERKSVSLHEKISSCHFNVAQSILEKVHFFIIKNIVLIFLLTMKSFEIWIFKKNSGKICLNKTKNVEY